VPCSVTSHGLGINLPWTLVAATRGYPHLVGQLEIDDWLGVSGGEKITYSLLMVSHYSLLMATRSHVN
jgi:hypothetical protein